MAAACRRIAEAEGISTVSLEEDADWRAGIVLLRPDGAALSAPASPKAGAIDRESEQEFRGSGRAAISPGSWAAAVIFEAVVDKGSASASRPMDHHTSSTARSNSRQALAVLVRHTSVSDSWRSSATRSATART